MRGKKKRRKMGGEKRGRTTNIWEGKMRSGEAFQSGRKNEREEEKMRSGEAF